MNQQHIIDIARIVDKYRKDNGIARIGGVSAPDWQAIADEVERLSTPRVKLISDGTVTEFAAGSCALNQAMISLIKCGESFEVVPVL